jgi:psp operon transcriptional activator
VSMVKELELEYFAGFSDTVQQQLIKYSWPGNIRELKNVIERAVYQHPEKTVTSLVFNPFESPFRPSLSPVRDQPAEKQDNQSAPVQSVHNEMVASWNGEPLDFRQHMQDYEIDVLKKAMEHCQFNQRKTAEFLSLSYHQLRGYLRKYDLLP